MQPTLKVYTLVAVFAGVMSFAGCAKKAAQATPPTPPPPPTAPTATLAANPMVLEQGQTTTLTWQTNNATTVNIDGLGTVPASGSQTVTPSASMTYNLVAKGPGGTQDASARVTVNTKVSAAPAPSDADLFARNVNDVLFDYDKADIRADQAPVTKGDAEFLLQHPGIKIVVEGHCDDRGSEEYNLALGASRAESVKRTLLQQGVPSDHVKTMSYGKEKPFCTQDNDLCWAKNRVDHFAMAQ
jgi:peptidoglycan-associated lipoprotein